VLKLGKIPIKSPRIASRIIGGEAVIVHPSKGFVYALNKTGSQVWKAMDGKRTVADIVGRIVKEYDVVEGEARKDVSGFLNALKRREIIIFK